MSHPRAMRVHTISQNPTFVILRNEGSAPNISTWFTTNIAIATTSIRIIWSIYTWTKLRTMKYHPLPHSARQAAYRASSLCSLSFRSQICETIRTHQRRTSTVTAICDICISDWIYDMTAMSTKPKPQNTSTMELSLTLREKRKRRIYEMRRVRRIEVIVGVYREIWFCKKRKISILIGLKYIHPWSNPWCIQ